MQTFLFPNSFAQSQQELISNNTTHFTVEELERLLAAFKRVTEDRLQVRYARLLPNSADYYSWGRGGVI